MEIDVKKYEVAESIDFNFEQLKNEVAVKMNDYKGLTYTDKQVAEAKKDLATLRKFVTALDDTRKDVKNSLLAPYKEFESKLNEVKAPVLECIEMIDVQVKNFEESRKGDKEKEIQEIYDSIELPKPDFDILSVIYNPKWLNATYSKSSIENEIRTGLVKYSQGMVTISKLTEFQYETLKEFQKTLDLGKALEKQMELREEAEKKAEFERQKITSVEEEKPDGEVPVWIGFEALLTPTNAHSLALFLKGNGIQYRKPQNNK